MKRFGTSQIIHRRLFGSLSLILSFVLMGSFAQTVFAHVEIESTPPNNYMLLDALEHASGKIGAGQIYRNWSDLPADQNPSNPRCRYEVTESYDLPNGPGGEPRKAYRFKVIGNADGRAHAFEAGGYADSSHSQCQSTGHNNAWNGSTVNLNDSIFQNPISGAVRTRPTNVYVGVTDAQEDAAASDGLRQSISRPDYESFDLNMKLEAGIRRTTDGGAYGFIADAGGYKVNGQTIWCAGIDIGNLNNAGPRGNIQWPGTFQGDCRWDHRFKAGQNNPGDGNFETNWGAYAQGAMTNTDFRNGGRSSAVRCGSCSFGSEAPGLTRNSDGIVENFGLIVAGIKNHDGAGTFQNNPDFAALSAPYNNIDWRARNLTPTPYPVPFAEAWLVMEWDTETVEEEVELSCNIRVEYGRPEAGQQFNAWLDYEYNGPANDIQYYSNVIGTPGSVTEETSFPSTGGATVTGSINRGNHSGPAGRYPYEAWIQVKDREATRAECPGVAIIVAKPYFKVWSGDVQIGGNFRDSDGQCSPAAAETYATVIGYGTVRNASGEARGASGEYAVSALGEVRNFNSLGRRGPRTSTVSNWPVPPHGWTFANADISLTDVLGLPVTIPPGDPGDSSKAVNYGGVSELTNCAANWFDSELYADADVVSGDSSSVGALNEVARVDKTTGNFTISGGNVSQSKTVYIPNENVTTIITDNITASNGATLQIIAAGDIKITPNVNGIDAVLISRKTLYTCTASDGSLYPRNQLYNRCGGGINSGGKLIVRGAVIANSIKLQRAAGTQSISQPNEGAFFGGAAEEFIFDPTILTTPSSIDTSTGRTNQIDSITSLPPIL